MDEGEAKGMLGSWQNVYEQVGLDKDASESMVHDLIAEASAYKEGLRDKWEEIRNYQSSIDQDENVVRKKTYDYLNDMEVFGIMREYLLTCGREYVCQILKNPKCGASRAIVRESFRGCEGDTPISLMEQVDVFLHRFENEWKNEYF